MVLMKIKQKLRKKKRRRMEHHKLIWQQPLNQEVLCSATFCIIQGLDVFNTKLCSTCAGWSQFRLIWRIGVEVHSAYTIHCQVQLLECLLLEYIDGQLCNSCKMQSHLSKTRLVNYHQKQQENLLVQINFPSSTLRKELRSFLGCSIKQIG